MRGWSMYFSFGLLIMAMLAGCVGNPSKEEEEAAKNTFVCLLEGERLVIRFDSGTARMLLPTGDTVSLYQIPATSGLRFSNGNLELRGKGTDLTLVDYNSSTAVALTQCGPYTPPPH